MLINIQWLRFVAATLVVLYHTADHVRASGHAAGPLFGWAHASGFAGVDIFFVISGFIMAWTTADAAGGASAWAFTRRRVARIYSGYWPFYLLALGLFTLLGGSYLVNKHLLDSFLLWPTPLQHLLLPVSWTLIFEMVFYLLFALVIALAGASGLRRTMWLAAISLAMLCWSGYSQFVRHAYDPGQLEHMSVYEQYLAFPYMLEFLAGALLAGWLRRHPQGLGWTLFLAGMVLWMAGGRINTEVFQDRLIQGYYVNWRILIFGSAALLIVAGLTRLEFRSITCARRFGLLAGGASYALYLSHTLILAATQKMGLNAWAAQRPAWLAQAVFIALVVLIVGYSMAHYRWLERPLHRLFRRVLQV